jgi:hypothetical protein
MIGLDLEIILLHKTEIRSKTMDSNNSVHGWNDKLLNVDLSRCKMGCFTIIQSYAGLDVDSIKICVAKI